MEYSYIEGKHENTVATKVLRRGKDLRESKFCDHDSDAGTSEKENLEKNSLGSAAHPPHRGLMADFDDMQGVGHQGPPEQD